MIKRIVKLTFSAEAREDFISVFTQHKIDMKAFPACKKLESMEDIDQPGLFFTYSIWDSEEALEEYRSSDYFRKIWGTIKPWFDERPQAWSLR